MEAAEEEDWCGLFSCVCRWSRDCSDRIHHVAPGYDYVSLPADADGRRPAWSLLAGFIDGAKLRLHRLRVARCGRILGRSNDALEIVHDLGKMVIGASASLAPDGVSLAVLHKDYQTTMPQPLLLQLSHAKEMDGRITTKELPPLTIEPEVPCCFITAAGHIWAPCIKFLWESREFSMVMLRLLQEDAGGGQIRWERVGECVVGPDEPDEFNPWGGRFLQGYAVLPLCRSNRTLILVSLRPYGLFFTFDCSTYAWTEVDTNKVIPGRFHIPILRQGVYIQEDETVYMLRENTIYAYKLHYDEDCRLKLEPPLNIESLCPFMSTSGYGLLAHLGSRLMCSVWISVGHRCSCRNLHAIVTTFQLQAHGEIKILHSTCRRIDMLPSMPNLDTHEFCFLQECKDEELSHSSVLQLEEDPIISHPTAKAPLLLECCRRSELLDQPTPIPDVPLKPDIAHIKPDLFVICQAGTQSIVYKTTVMDDIGRLERDDGKLRSQFGSIPDYCDDCCDMLEEQPPPLWHFICGSSYIYAVSGRKDGRHVFGFRNKLPTFDPRFRRIDAAPFVMAIRVSRMTIALTDALEVFKQIHFGYSGQSSWLRCQIDQYRDQCHVQKRKIKLSGYAVLGDDSFIVCDALTNSCLLFDLSIKQWRVVWPHAKFKYRGSHVVSSSPRRFLLNGRSIFVDGFIYTCGDGGLDAYELVKDDDTVFLSGPIFLPLSSEMVWENETMCLDYAGKDASGGIIFFVVQGGYPPTWPKHHVRIITVHVNTEKTPGNEGKMKPVKIGHLDCVTRSVEHEKGVGRLSARHCFAFSSCASAAPSNHLMRSRDP